MSSTSQTSQTKQSGNPRFSVIIPARDEERRIGACLESIRMAAAHPRDGAEDSLLPTAEVIVVLNRCTDRTGEIARAHGARTIEADGKNLSLVRNAGARAASGDIIVTIDADSVMAPNTLDEIDRRLASGKFIGGGAMIRPERMSPGIFATGILLLYLAARYRVSAGLFWTTREVFEALGGFDESRVTVEDIDFAVRLKQHGKQLGKRFGTLWNAPITTSCRKFDHFGDWFIIKNPAFALDLFRGNEHAANAFFYDFPR